MFRTVLVANRGEIARRVFRSLREMGIRSVAVYSDADANAPFVGDADIAIRIGPASAADSYLNIEAVISAARDVGADAIHPGYGFLSENVAFAQACEAAGIVFIGPSIEALQIMADKITSKEHVASHGVPIVPGFSAAGLSDDEIADRCTEIGFPLLIKPSAGGGGKGMQIVRERGEIAGALVTARRIATASFGDDTMLIERLLERPRHIEVQVLGDNFGTIVHLGERECTLQRRHQKVIEEAPSAVVDEATRARLGQAAVDAAKSVNYRGAGTVEFLVAGSDVTEFFFIEMNTRLQVEHPITEMVTGIDLVREQLRVAADEALGLTQQDISLTGHAFEARLYAEAPHRGFLPATGTVLAWKPSARTRNDSAVESGTMISSHYDPMIAKVIAYGRDREQALRTLSAALRETVVLGVDTNIEFLIDLVESDAVQEAELDTGLIDRLGTPERDATNVELVSAAASTMQQAFGSGPWLQNDGWRSSDRALTPTWTFSTDDDQVLETHSADAPASATIATDEDGCIWVHSVGQTRSLVPLSRREQLNRHLATLEATTHREDPEARAPMPGTVVAVHVVNGDTVAVGDRLVTIEAMKMEHPILATATGTVTLDVATGQTVGRNQRVAHLTIAETNSKDASHV